MDANELARLRVVAKAAQKSDWRVRTHPDHPEGTLSIYAKTGWVIRPAKHGGFLNENEDAAHIATFDPPTVLALLDKIERLQAGREVEQDDDRVYRDIKAERRYQEVKWGEQNHDPMVWGAILGEEVGELAQAMLAEMFGGEDHSSHSGPMRQEAIQVAAVAVAFIEYLDRRDT